METLIIIFVAFVVAVVGVRASIVIVPQSQNYVTERFGKYNRTLNAGLHFIVPFIERVAHKVTILERSIPDFIVPGITKDNVDISVQVSTFYRVTNPETSVYRIRNIEESIRAIVTGAVRSNLGEIDFDTVQSNRRDLNAKIAEQLLPIAETWGIQISRSEVIGVNVSEEINRALQLQMSAERERRAAVTRAQGAKEAEQLAAEAQLYAAQKEAEAKELQATADARVIKIVAEAMKEHGERPMELDLIRRQISAMEGIASAPSAKTVVLPSDMTSSLVGFGVLNGINNVKG